MGVDDVSPALQARLGPAATVGLLALLDTARDQWTDDVTAVAIERFERRLSEDVGGVRVAVAQGEANLRVEIHQGINSLRDDMRDGAGAFREEMRNLRVDVTQDMSKLRVELVDAMAKLQVNVMRWSFAMWVGQLVAIAAVVAAMFEIYAP